MRLTRRHTLYFLAFMAGLALVYEMLSLSIGNDATISRAVWSLHDQVWLFILLGILIGHFGWPPGMCRNCGLRPTHPPMGGVGFAIDERLRVYASLRLGGEMHEQAKLDAGFPEVRG